MAADRCFDCNTELDMREDTDGRPMAVCPLCEAQREIARLRHIMREQGQQIDRLKAVIREQAA